MILFCFIVLTVLTGIAPSRTQAAGSKVTSTLKDGVLTVRGTGEMPDDMTFRNDPDIKKVVIKKGVTSVSDYAFFGCSNLKTIKLPDGLVRIGVRSFAGTAVKTVVIPDSVREIGQEAFWNCRKLKTITMPGDFNFIGNEKDPDEWLERILTLSGFGDFAPKTITFTTPLKLENISLLSAKNYVVSDDDPLYSSIGGAIYSKDGTGLIRIPSERKSFKVAKGCTRVYISSYSYYCRSEDDYPVSRLEKLYLPKGSCEIALKPDEDNYDYYDCREIDVFAGGTRLDGRSIALLAQYSIKTVYSSSDDNNGHYVPDPSWFKGFGSLVTVRDDGCAVTHDGMLIKYLGEGGRVELGDDITGIASNAFSGTKITSVNIPSGVKYIGEYAFSETSELKAITIPASVSEFGAYALSNSGIEKIVFENGITVIPDSICYSCQNLKTAVIPSSVEEIASRAFMYCTNFNIDKYSGFKDLPWLTKVGSFAFSGCIFKDFTVPEKIKEIGELAFTTKSNAKKTAQITVEGDTSGFAPNSFLGNVHVTYLKGISEDKAYVSRYYLRNTPDKNGYFEMAFNWYPLSDADGIEIEVSTDSNFSDAFKSEACLKDAVKDSDSRMVATLKVYVKSSASYPDFDWWTDGYARARLFTEQAGTRKYSDWVYIN